MFNFFKKKKKVNVIANRIKNLDNKLWLIYITGKESTVERKIRYFRTSGMGTSKEYRMMTLNTYFGERKIAINDNSMYYGNDDLIQDSVDNNDWSFNFNFIFCIELKDTGLPVIKFADNVKMTKEEIDLAVLEFELAADSIYSRITERNESYKNMVDYLVNGV